MLAEGPYPGWLKARIGGPFGHLANAAAAVLLAALDRSRLRHVLAAHLSEKNNLPELARGALAGALGCAPDWIGVAGQADGFDWREL
jgi:phosphoribosyl 1,2-cyclic phosphodiesterase